MSSLTEGCVLSGDYQVVMCVDVMTMFLQRADRCASTSKPEILKVAKVAVQERTGNPGNAVLQR